MTQSEHPVGATLQGGEGEPRIAILVLGCLLDIYDRCIRTIRATWASQRRPNVDVFYVYGGQDAGIDPQMVDIEHLIGHAPPPLRDYEVWASGDVILCGAADVYAGQRDCILRKRLIAFGYAANQGRYDFVYTVCATSYVDVDVLQRYVAGLPPSGVYHGPLCVDGPTGHPFVSGASMLLSRDIAADLADSAQAIVAANVDGNPDDVAIGRWILDNYCAESAAEIRRRIAAQVKATDNQAFVLPYGNGIVDYVDSPVESQLPREQAYHYHFHSGRIQEMAHFHHRFFAP
jgi:hypothetical protein